MEFDNEGNLIEKPAKPVKKAEDDKAENAAEAEGDAEATPAAAEA